MSEQTSERMSEWPCAYVCILGCSEPQCTRFLSPSGVSGISGLAKSLCFLPFPPNGRPTALFYFPLLFSFCLFVWSIFVRFSVRLFDVRISVCKVIHLIVRFFVRSFFRPFVRSYLFCPQTFPTIRAIMKLTFCQRFTLLRPHLLSSTFLTLSPGDTVVSSLKWL